MNAIVDTPLLQALAAIVRKGITKKRSILALDTVKMGFRAILGDDTMAAAVTILARDVKPSIDLTTVSAKSFVEAVKGIKKPTTTVKLTPAGVTVDGKHVVGVKLDVNSPAAAITAVREKLAEGGVKLNVDFPAAAIAAVREKAAEVDSSDLRFALDCAGLYAPTDGPAKNRVAVNIKKGKVSIESTDGKRLYFRALYAKSNKKDFWGMLHKDVGHAIARMVPTGLGEISFGKTDISATLGVVVTDALIPLRVEVVAPVMSDRSIMPSEDGIQSVLTRAFEPGYLVHAGELAKAVAALLKATPWSNDHQLTLEANGRLTMGTAKSKVRWLRPAPLKRMDINAKYLLDLLYGIDGVVDIMVVDPSSPSPMEPIKIGNEVEARILMPLYYGPPIKHNFGKRK